MYDKILQLIKERGPSLPAEISGKLDMNSFMAKALLEDLVTQGKLKLGEKVGTTNIFFMPGQEELAKKRAEETLETPRTVGGHVGKDLDMSPDAVAKREQFKKHFEKDIIRLQEEEQVKKSAEKPIKQEPTQQVKLPVKTQTAQDLGFAPLEKIEQQFRLPEPVTPPAKKVEIVVQKPIVKPVEKKIVPKEGYVDKIVKLCNTDKARVVEEINIAKKAAELVVDFPSSIGAMQFYVEIKDKKSISKADVSIAYTEGLTRKLPSMIITNGKLAKAAEKYAESLGSLFKIKTIQ